MASFEVTSCGDDTILRNKYGVYSKKELESQLEEGHLTVDELGSIYNLKTYQMVHVLRVLNISFRNNVNDTRIIDPTISPSLHQVLLGTLLGDAFMYPKTYSLKHGLYQMDYCYHVAERFHKFVATFEERDTKVKTEKCFGFWTYRHDVFRSYYKRFYSRGKGKKLITIDTASDLEAEGLAYWFMDDGKYGPSGFVLSVGDITTEEGSILIDLLRTKFGIETTFQNHDIKKGYHVIYIRAESRSKFLELVSPYIISSMAYKINGSDRPRDAYDESKIAARHVEFCNKAGRSIRYSGNAHIQDLVNNLGTKHIDFKNQYTKGILEAIKVGSQISKTNIRKIPSKEELIKLFEQGLTDQQIGSQYGLGRNRIAEMRRSLKIGKKSTRLTPDQKKQIEDLFRSGASISQIMNETHLSFYTIKRLTNGSCHQHLMKERYLENDLKNLSFNPDNHPISDYVFSKEDYSDELSEFLKRYEWLGSVGVYPRWCFTMRLNGVLAGLQIFNEPTAYSKILGDRTMKLESLIQRGCTVSWAHQHLGSRMLMMSIDWMVKNTDKRVFVGYSDPRAGEIGTIYQACNFKYLGSGFGVKKKYCHPIHKNGKEFCEHSLRRTSVFKWWCKKNGVVVDPSWIKPNGFKDVTKIPNEIRKAWYGWGDKIISESKSINVEAKGKYVLIRGKDKREQRELESALSVKIYPYPKRNSSAK